MTLFSQQTFGVFQQTVVRVYYILKVNQKWSQTYKDVAGDGLFSITCPVYFPEFPLTTYFLIWLIETARQILQK